MSDVQVFDVSLMQNLQIGKMRRKTAGTRSQKTARSAVTPSVAPSRRSTRSNTEQHILRHVQSSALQKYCALCESLNIDPLAPYTLVLIVILLSRHPQRSDIARKFLSALSCDASTLMWDTAADLEFLQQKLSSSSDAGVSRVRPQ